MLHLQDRSVSHVKSQSDVMRPTEALSAFSTLLFFLEAAGDMFFIKVA